MFPLDWLIMNVKMNSNKIRFNHEKEKFIVNDCFKNLISAELKLREKAENLIKKMKLKAGFLSIKKNEDYEGLECDFCPSFGYFSLYKCKKCNFEGCLEHFSKCSLNCVSKEFYIYYRFTNRVNFY